MAVQAHSYLARAAEIPIKDAGMRASDVIAHRHEAAVS